jgi:hypothetical protein
MGGPVCLSCGGESTHTGVGGKSWFDFEDHAEFVRAHVGLAGIDDDVTLGKKPFRLKSPDVNKGLLRLRGRTRWAGFRKGF